MNDWGLSINFYFCNLMADERQRGSHEIVQSRGCINIRQKVDSNQEMRGSCAEIGGIE
jgi:hypothetical protein